MDEKNQALMLKSLTNLINISVSNGILIETIENLVQTNLTKHKNKIARTKKTKKKKKIARPPLFISDSSDNE